MMTAEVNIAIGAIDRIFKMTKDGKSNNRERQTPSGIRSLAHSVLESSPQRLKPI
jgi:hypothetical protein